MFKMHPIGGSLGLVKFVKSINCYTPYLYFYLTKKGETQMTQKHKKICFSLAPHVWEALKKKRETELTNASAFVSKVLENALSAEIEGGEEQNVL